MDSNLFRIPFPFAWKKLRRNNEACLKNTMYTYIYINFVSKKNEDFLLINEEIINRFDGCMTIIGIISEEKRQALMAVSNATERAVSSPVRDSLRARNACAWIMRARPRVGSRERLRGHAVANGATREEKSAWACDEINSPPRPVRVSARAHAFV